MNWQVLLCGKLNIKKKNPLVLNWNTQLEISKKLYFQNLFWKHQNDLFTAVHFYNFEYNGIYTIQALGLSITFFSFFFFFGNKIFFLLFECIIINTSLSSPQSVSILSNQHLAFEKHFLWGKKKKEVTDLDSPLSAPVAWSSATQIEVPEGRSPSPLASWERKDECLLGQTPFYLTDPSSTRRFGAEPQLVSVPQDYSAAWPRKALGS